MLLINEPPVISPVPADHPPPVSGGLLATEARSIVGLVCYPDGANLPGRASLRRGSGPLLQCTNVYLDRSFSSGLRSFLCNTTFGDHRKEKPCGSGTGGARTGEAEFPAMAER